jgi:hypothetical protein
MPKMQQPCLYEPAFRSAAMVADECRANPETSPPTQQIDAKDIQSQSEDEARAY